MSIAPELDGILTAFAETSNVALLSNVVEKFGELVSAADGSATLQVSREVGLTVVSVCAKLHSLFSSDAWWCMLVLFNPKVYSWAAELLQESVDQKLYVPVMAQITTILRRKESTERHIDKILQLLLIIIPSHEHSLAPVEDSPIAYTAILQELPRQFATGTAVNQRRVVDIFWSVLAWKENPALVSFIRAGGVSAIVRCYEKVLEDALSGDLESTAGGHLYIFIVLTMPRAVDGLVAAGVAFKDSEDSDVPIPAELMLDRDLCLRIRNLCYEIFKSDLAKPGKKQAHPYIGSVVCDFLHFVTVYAPPRMPSEVASYKPTEDEGKWVSLWLRWVKTFRDHQMDYRVSSLCKRLCAYTAFQVVVRQCVEMERVGLIDAPLRRCARQHCQVTTEHTFTQLRKCKRCRAVYYCTSTCQRSHWPEHRKICVKWIPPEEARKGDLTQSVDHELQPNSVG